MIVGDVLHDQIQFMFLIETVSNIFIKPVSVHRGGGRVARGSGVLRLTHARSLEAPPIYPPLREPRRSHKERERE